MASTLDTSGEINCGGDPYDGVAWADLSPFAQGYVEALLRSMEPQPGQWFRMPSGGVHVGATFLRFGTVNGVESKAWAIVRLDRGGKRCAGPTRHELVSKLTPRFSDLSPEALTMILRDCEAYGGYRSREAGAHYWDQRQAGKLEDFPPLLVSLDDAGKVQLGEVTS